MGSHQWRVVAALAATLLPTCLSAGVTLYSKDDTSLNLGINTRDDFTLSSYGAPNGSDPSKGFNLESIRPTLDVKVNDHLEFSFNMDYASNNTMQVLDAVAQYDFSDTFNVWVGRFLPPSDRANLSGPYYGDAWDFPGVVQSYPAIFAGRDNGLAVWGQVGGGLFKWQAGAFNGRKGAFNQHDNLLGAGRLVLNFLDPEPGYYNSSTYYGAKKILAIGLSGMSQSEGAGSVNNTNVVTSMGSYSAWNADLLSETPLGGAGTFTVEGAYYRYDTQGALGQPEGTGSSATVAYLLPSGHIKPLARWQNFVAASSTGAEPSNSKLDLELDYIVNGDSERYALVYSNLRDSHGVVYGDVVKLGGQLSF